MEKLWKKMDEDALRERRRRQRQKCINCFKKMAAFLFSHIGLAAMVVAYSIAGGFLFRWLEAPYEVRTKLEITDWKKAKILEIWQSAVELKKNPNFNKSNFTRNVAEILLAFQTQVTTAVKEDGWDGNDSTDMRDVQWSFAGALLYAVTVITTIGYGHVAPKTSWGRLVTIVYALVGIPLTFLYLSNIGNFLADCFKMFYKKICCDLCCCQKCERKKKRERMRLKKRREWAAQKNSLLKATSSAQYTNSAQDDISCDDNVIVLPGHDIELGHDNLTAENDDEGPDIRIEEGCLGGCPSPARDPSVEQWRDFPDDMRETAIIGDGDDIKETAILDDNLDNDLDVEGNAIKETAILDSDTDEESGLGASGSTNFGSLSDPTKIQSLFTKLDDAKETAILDDSDDEVFELEPQPESSKGTEKKLSKSTSEGGSKKGKSKSARTLSPHDEGTSKSKSTLKRGSVKDKKKERSRSSEKDKKGEGTSSSKEKDKDNPKTLTRDRSTSKGKHKPSKKMKRKDTKKKKDHNSKKKKSNSKSKKESDSGDETRHIIEDIPSGCEHVCSDDESFVTARAESGSYVGEDGDIINGGYQADVITQQPERGIVTIATEDGVVKYDPDSVTLDVGTNAPYDVDTLDYRDISDPYVDMDYDDEDEDEKVTVPISICLIIIAGYIFGGSVLFTLWEEWDYLTGSYFCFITLSTIGFGDIVPGTDMKEWASSEKLVLCALWLAFGLSLLAMCFNLMQEEVKEKCKWVGQKLGLLRDENEG